MLLVWNQTVSLNFAIKNIQGSTTSMEKLSWIWISPCYTDVYKVMNSFPIIYSICLSQLPRSTERSEKEIREGEADKKQINLLVCPTSIWNIHIHIYIYIYIWLCTCFLFSCIRYMPSLWSEKCGKKKKKDENGKKSVNIKIEIYSFYIRTALLLWKLKHHNGRE